MLNGISHKSMMFKIPGPGYLFSSSILKKKNQTKPKQKKTPPPTSKRTKHSPALFNDNLFANFAHKMVTNNFRLIS